MKILPALVLCSVLLPVSLPAQSKKQSPDDDVVLSTTQSPQTPVVPLGLKANEAHRVFTITVRNPEKRDWQVYGIQTMGCFYVVDVPRKIPAEGKTTVGLMYIAKPGVTGGVGVVSIMTDAGEKIIQRDHGREQSASLDADNLEWRLGGVSDTKSVILTLPPGASVARSVKAMGSDNKASIESIGNGQYRVSITPASTAKAQKFPVFIEISPTVPDFSPVILCTIAQQE